jgi:hypothetical protein
MVVLRLKPEVIVEDMKMIMEDLSVQLTYRAVKILIRQRYDARS